MAVSCARCKQRIEAASVQYTATGVVVCPDCFDRAGIVADLNRSTEARFERRRWRSSWWRLAHVPIALVASFVMVKELDCERKDKRDKAHEARVAAEQRDDKLAVPLIATLRPILAKVAATPAPVPLLDQWCGGAVDQVPVVTQPWLAWYVAGASGPRPTVPSIESPVFANLLGSSPTEDRIELYRALTKQAHIGLLLVDRYTPLSGHSDGKRQYYEGGAFSGAIAVVEVATGAVVCGMPVVLRKQPPPEPLFAYGPSYDWAMEHALWGEIDAGAATHGVKFPHR